MAAETVTTTSPFQVGTESWPDAESPSARSRAASSAMTASDDVDARMDNSKGMDEPLELSRAHAGQAQRERGGAERAVVASSSEVSAAAPPVSRAAAASKAATASKGGSSKQGSGNGTANGNLKTTADDTKPPLAPSDRLRLRLLPHCRQRGTPRYQRPADCPSVPGDGGGSRGAAGSRGYATEAVSSFQQQPAQMAR